MMSLHGIINIEQHRTASNRIESASMSFFGKPIFKNPPPESLAGANYMASSTLHLVHFSSMSSLLALEDF